LIRTQPAVLRKQHNVCFMDFKFGRRPPPILANP
jgi:hypothetical protein